MVNIGNDASLLILFVRKPSLIIKIRTGPGNKFVIITQRPDRTIQIKNFIFIDR